jgi:hypothetical protein
LEEYRWTLTASSRSADFLRAAIHLLDTSTNLLQYVPEKPELNEFVSMHPQVLSGDGQASAFSASQERSAEVFDGFSSPATSMSSERDFEAEDQCGNFDG